MKFYEVKQQANNLSWHSLGYFRKKADAELYCGLFNTKVTTSPTKIYEHEFLNIKDYEEELNED